MIYGLRNSVLAFGILGLTSSLGFASYDPSDCPGREVLATPDSLTLEEASARLPPYTFYELSPLRKLVSQLPPAVQRVAEQNAGLLRLTPGRSDSTFGGVELLEVFKKNGELHGQYVFLAGELTVLSTFKLHQRIWKVRAGRFTEMFLFADKRRAISEMGPILFGELGSPFNPKVTWYYPSRAAVP